MCMCEKRRLTGQVSNARIGTNDWKYWLYRLSCNITYTAVRWTKTECFLTLQTFVWFISWLSYEEEHRNKGREGEGSKDKRDNRGDTKGDAGRGPEGKLKKRDRREETRLKGTLAERDKEETGDGQSTRQKTRWEVKVRKYGIPSQVNKIPSTSPEFL